MLNTKLFRIRLTLSVTVHHNIFFAFTVIQLDQDRISHSAFSVVRNETPVRKLPPGQDN